MADGLAAEIAAHYDHWGQCERCHRRWPCLVRRLADRETAARTLSEQHLAGAQAAMTAAEEARQERDALRDGVLRVIRGMEGTAENWGDGPAGQFAGPMLRHVRSLVRALAPADGEDGA